MKNLFYKIKKDRRKVVYLGIGFLVLILLILIPFSFAELTPVKSVNIYSKNSSYDDNSPGAWKIEKSGKWISKGTAEVTFNVDTKSMIKTSKTDVILVLDTSGSMIEDENYNFNGESRFESRINILKYNCRNFLENIFSSGDNRVGLIRFSNDSQILSDLTKDKDSLLSRIDSFYADGETNYYNALVDVGNMLKSYQKEADRETIVLFLTDGLPNINTPNEVAQYKYLKSQYPWLTINGIQYEMGSVILDPIKKVTDNQFFADSEALNNALLEASVPKLNYEEFNITDYIDTRYFKVEKESDISVNVGKFSFDINGQNITWNIDNLRSGVNIEDAKPEMKIKVKLKDELIGKGGVYPTNSREVINTKIENKIENVDSSLTPILADNYKVKYNGNAPSGCNITGVPADESHSVFDTVDISDNAPTCEGYKFKGWKILDEDIKKVGSNRFIMPEEDVEVKAMWGKVGLKKSMDGEISTTQTLYEMIRDNSRGDDQNLNFMSNSTSGIYQHYKTKDEKYPIYYYRGEVNNNLIFANMCWKIVRTTETGGVKLLYNGVPTGDGSCNNTGDAVTIGESAFNNSYNSPAYVGYKYGKAYSKGSMNYSAWYELVGKSSVWKSSMASTNYYYGDGVTYVEGVGYTLNNAKQYYWSDYYSELDHYYTCLNNVNGVCDRVYFILSSSDEDGRNYSSSSGFYYVEMTNGETYENLYSEAEKAFWIFGNDVSYNGSNYILIDPIVVSKLKYLTDENEKNKVRNAHHYTCFDDSYECSESVYYVYETNVNFDYIILQDGIKIEKALKEMTSESPNENKSAILTYIDEWYEKNLKDTIYEKYIEDTIWCNDRSIYDLGGWDKDGDLGMLFFSPNKRLYSPSFECVNETDRFSTTNPKAKLDYPVGLLTQDEVTFAGTVYYGGNNSKLYLYAAGVEQWYMSPYFFNDPASGVFFGPPTLDLGGNVVSNKYAVRPSISLESGVIIENGDGSVNNPYTLMNIGN